MVSDKVRAVAGKCHCAVNACQVWNSQRSTCTRLSSHLERDGSIICSAIREDDFTLGDRTTTGDPPQTKLVTGVVERAVDVAVAVLQLEQIAGLATTLFKNDGRHAGTGGRLDEDAALAGIGADNAQQSAVGSRSESQETAVVVQAGITGSAGDVVTTDGVEFADVVLRSLAGNTTSGTGTVGRASTDRRRHCRQSSDPESGSLGHHRWHPGTSACSGSLPC